MKKITFLLVALCATLFTNAANYTLTMSDYAAVSFTSTDGVFTVATAQGAGASAPVYNTTALDLRVYANNTLTITSPEAMTSISFGISPKGEFRLAPVAASVGSVVVKGDPDFTAVWTGNAKTVTFTVGAQADYGKDGSTKAGQLCFTTLDIVTNGEGGGTDPIDPDPTETAMTGFNYVDATYFTSEEAGYWAFDLYNDYDNGAYVYPDLYMEVVANNSSTIAGTYEVDYAEFSTSETNTIVFASGTITVTALGTIDGDSYPEYSFEGTFQDESGNSYTVSLNKGVWAYNYDTDEDITLNDDVAIRNIEVLNNVFANGGRIYTQETARIYTITGLDVTSMNGNLEGLYIVKAGNKVAKVMVTK